MFTPLVLLDMLQTCKSLLSPNRFILLLLLVSFNSFALDVRQKLSLIVDQSIDKSLWKNSEWLKLLHYEKKNNSYLSQVDDGRFFYAKNGKYNPQAELAETLKQLFIPTENHNQQTQCRFIARSEWLIKQLHIEKSLLPEVRCEEYLEWYAMAKADSVTLIFPTYHLNSPSSMFGHTLLRLDKYTVSQSEWLSFAVNFGADTSNEDNGFMYAYQGLVGGYPGLFITEPYFKKIQEYNRIEHRDIWEYKLTLTAEETDRIIKHLWELKTIKFDYYFFDENCSYRLLELIEIARPGIELTDEFVLTAIPVDTVRAIENANLIESVNYRPSQVTQIEYGLEELTEEHKDLVLKLSKNFSVSNTMKFLQLSEAEQKKIVSLSYQYLRYLTSSEARDPGIAKRQYKLLQLLNSYPADVSPGSRVPVPISPAKGHKSKRFSFGLGQRLNNQYINLGFKMSFHDLEDNQKGFLQGAQINIGSVEIRAEENVGLRLDKLDIVDIFSLTPRNKFFSPLSWKINTGFERQLTHDTDQLVYQLSGGAGGAWEIMKNHQYYSLAIIRLEINKMMKNDIEPAVGFNTGFISHFQNQTAHLALSGEQFEDGLYRLRIKYTHNFVLSTNQSLKLFVEQQWQEDDVEFSNVNLSYQFYF